jgi:hypothetical protein
MKVEFLQSLHFPAMYARQKAIRVALDNTCNWLFLTPEYNDWIDRKNISSHHGLLWIKGKPGAGKSTLMKEALHRTEEKNAETKITTAGFFFNARGTEQLEKTPLGFYRSILHQVLQQDLKALSHAIPKYLLKRSTERQVEWHEEDLQNILIRTYATQESNPAFIFIDALDECNEDEVRNVVDFLRDLTTKAWAAGAQLNVCLSSRHYPHIRVPKCPEVVVERHNEQDILQYIRTEAEHIETISELQDRIFQKSSGVFLWVVLVVSMLKKSSYGKSLKWMEKKLEETPPELNTLFRQLFAQMDSEDATKAVCLMQWILFAEERLKLSELHCAIGFRGKHSYQSIQLFEESDEFLTPKTQLELVITLSRGLVEPVISQTDESAEDPTFQFIHESVRDFFLKGSGFRLLDRTFEGSVVGQGHSTLAWTSVNFLQASEIHSAAQQRTFSSEAHPTTFSSHYKQFILLRYVGCYLFKHIEAAEKLGVSQEAVLRRLLSNNSKLHRRLQGLFVGTRIWKLMIPQPELTSRIYIDNYEVNESLLYACSRRSLVSCVAKLIHMGQDVNAYTATIFRYPLLAAVSTLDSNKPSETTVALLL